MTSNPPLSPLVRIVLLLTGLATIVGCGRPAGVVFEPPLNAPSWPAPPETPRVRYVGQLQTDQDLKPAQRPGRRVGEFLFGKDDAHSMLSPLAVSVGASKVFIADSNGQMLHVFDLDSRKYQQWRPAKEQTQFSMPVAVAADLSGRAMVSDSVAGLVFVFDSTGKCTSTLGAGKLKRPCGIAIEPATGRILIVDSAAHQVVVFSSSGEEVARIGQRGSDPGNFNFPTNITLDRAGRMYVSDTLNFRIQVFSPDFQPLRQIGTKGDKPGYFSQPKGLALDSDEHLYVVDANFEAVQVFDPQGELLMSFGREGHGPGEFWLPAGICIDPTGRIWVADTYNRRVQVFQYLTEDHAP